MGEIGEGLDAIAGPNDEFLQYVDYRSTESCLKALYDLEKHVEEEGPYDGIISFSLGATLAASLMIHKLRKNQRKELLQPTFRCAVFFCGGLPEEMSADGKNRRVLSFEQDGELIQFPTAHVWGANDQVYPEFGTVLSKLCLKDSRAVFVHPGGHEIPGPKDEQSLQGAIRVIKQTIERAEEKSRE